MDCLRVLSIVIAGGFSMQLAAAPPPAEAYGRLPAIGSAAISPDGKRVALSVGFEYKVAEPDRELTALRIVNLDSGTIEHTLPSPPRNTLRGVGWADDDRAYYFISAPANAKDAAPSASPFMMRGDRVEFFRTGVYSLQSKTAIQLMQSAEFRYNTSLTNLQVPIEGDPGYGRVVTWGGAGTMNAIPRVGVYRVNLENGSSSPVFEAMPRHAAS